MCSNIQAQPRWQRLIYRPLLFSFLSILILSSLKIPAQEPASAEKAQVMWALSGVLPRDRAHWIRNFDFRQMVPGISVMPIDLIPEDPLFRFQPEDLRQLASICDEAGCRFFFVVELSGLSEQVHSTREGKRQNFQQIFSQNVSLTAYRKAPGSTVWEKINPVSETAQHKDMIGTSDDPQEQRAFNINRQRCEFLREVPAETAANLVGEMVVELKKSPKPPENKPPGSIAFTLTNRSPLELNSLYIWVPMKGKYETRDQEFLFGETQKQMTPLGPYESKSGMITITPEKNWEPQTGQARVTVSGWSQEELNHSRGRRKRLRKQRNDWVEHKNLPPSAHEMDWETEEGE